MLLSLLAPASSSSSSTDLTPPDWLDHRN